MSEINLEKIKQTKKWPFTIGDLFYRYSFVLFPLFILLISIIEIKSGFKNNLGSLKVVGLMTAIIGLSFLLFILIRLYENQTFKSYKVRNLSKIKIENSLVNCGFSNYVFHSKGYYEVTTGISLFSWGELITIIPLDNEILINSKPTGSLLINQPITIFKDQRNIRKIVNNLND